jgi:anthranilate synthase component 1
MTLNLSVAEVIELATTNRVIPIIDTLFSGTETPVGLFQKLCGDRSGTFLLESAAQGVWSRYSFIGVASRGSLTKNTGEPARWHGSAPAFPTGNLTSELGALDALEQSLNAWSTPKLENLPPLTSGLVGMLGWDVVREIEHLPNRPKSDYRVPEMWFSMVSDLVIVDHQTSQLHLVANIFLEGEEPDAESSYQEALRRLSGMKEVILQPTTPFVAERIIESGIQLAANQTQETFMGAVSEAKKHIERGDVFQVVLSQRFDLDLQATPLDVYRALRALNPSPYMYLLQQSDEDGPYSVVGSSPEALVTVTEGDAVMHPIAGSRPRGSSVEADQANEASLLEDNKERAEHLMLVDLARNDLLKVCSPDSIEVTEFMAVHRFSHIMHLVSTVEGRVREGQSAVDVFRATFPAGTLSGAPKPRALEIIDALEPSSRGIFGGVVGYFDFDGSADLAITIRTAFLRDGIARIQAGAGIVLDSVPQTEFDETRTKAAAPARAVQAANVFGV